MNLTGPNPWKGFRADGSMKGSHAERAQLTAKFRRLIAEGAAALFGAKTMSLTSLEEDSPVRLKLNHFVMPLMDVSRIKKDPNVGITLFTFLALRAPHLLDPVDLAAFNNPEAPVQRRVFIPRAPALSNEEPSAGSAPPWSFKCCSCIFLYGRVGHRAALEAA